MPLVILANILANIYFVSILVKKKEYKVNFKFGDKNYTYLVYICHIHALYMYIHIH